jgi:hypothetical protein
MDGPANRHPHHAHLSPYIQTDAFDSYMSVSTGIVSYGSELLLVDPYEHEW